MEVIFISENSKWLRDIGLKIIPLETKLFRHFSIFKNVFMKFDFFWKFLPKLNWNWIEYLTALSRYLTNMQFCSPPCYHAMSPSDIVLNCLGLSKVENFYWDINSNLLLRHFDIAWNWEWRQNSLPRNNNKYQRTSSY